jgi:hypothetical protein
MGERREKARGEAGLAPGSREGFARRRVSEWGREVAVGRRRNRIRRGSVHRAVVKLARRSVTSFALLGLANLACDKAPAVTETQPPPIPTADLAPHTVSTTIEPLPPTAPTPVASADVKRALLGYDLPDAGHALWSCVDVSGPMPPEPDWVTVLGRTCAEAAPTRKERASCELTRGDTQIFAHYYLLEHDTFEQTCREAGGTWKRKAP